MRGIGSSESLQQNDCCCDVCTWSQCPHNRLDILKPTRQKSQKQPVAHDMTPSHVKELKTKLLEEREKILLEHPSYRMIGIDFVCPDSVLDKICEQSKYFSSVDDMKIYGVRPEFRDKLFRVVMDVISSIPPPTKKYRRVQ